MPNGLRRPICQKVQLSSNVGTRNRRNVWFLDAFFNAGTPVLDSSWTKYYFCELSESSCRGIYLNEYR